MTQANNPLTLIPSLMSPGALSSADPEIPSEVHSLTSAHINQVTSEYLNPVTTTNMNPVSLSNMNLVTSSHINEVTSSKNLLDLPIEIILKIFSNVSTQDLLLNVASASKMLNDVTQNPSVHRTVTFRDKRFIKIYFAQSDGAMHYIIIICELRHLGNYFILTKFALSMM